MTVTREQASDLALAEANRLFGFPTANDELIILDKSSRESEHAWVFAYNTRSSIETGDGDRGLLGNGPIVVDKATGKVQMYAFFTCEDALEFFETGDCKGTSREFAEILRNLPAFFVDDGNGLPPRPPQYTPAEWAEYHRDPCAWCIKELRNPDPSIRCNAADILRGLAQDAERSIPALIEGFSDPDEMVRGYCVYALVDIGYALKERAISAVPALTALLRDHNADVRGSAIQALGAIGPSAASATQELQRFLTDADQGIRESASWALGNLRNEGGA